MDNPWKKFERRVGKILGLRRGKQRTGPTGLMGFDVVGPRNLNVMKRRLGVEVKHTQAALPKWLSATLEQAREARRFHVKDEVMDHSMPPLEYYDYDPICVFGDAGRRDEDILCVVSLIDYVALRRKAAGWEEDLSDIRGYIAMETSRTSIGLNQWKQFLDFMKKVLDRYKKRGF